MPNKETLESEKYQHFLCIELLRKFSKKEIERLLHFVESRYFNSDKYVVKLLDVLKKKVLNKSQFSDALQKLVYEKVFAETVANRELNAEQKKRFNHKLSALLRLAERFLVVEGLEEHKAYRTDILHQKILEKRQFKLFNRHVKRDKKELKAQSETGIQYHQHQYHIEKKVLNYLYMSGQLNTQDNLPELTYNLDVMYIINKLSFHITSLHLEEATSKNYDTSSIEAINQLINLPQYAEHPLIRISLVAIHLIKTQSDAAYHELLLLLDKHTSSISTKDLNGFYIVATNFCTEQIKKGYFDYRALFDICRIMDEKNLFIERGFISVNKLKNITVAGCRVYEFDWALEMINKYLPFIEKAVQESVYHFNMGSIAFYQKDYKKALHHFVRVESINFTYDVNCRVIMMKAHYETDQEYDERTLQIFRSTEKYFNENQQLTARNKKAYKNFIRTLINIYRVRHRATKMKLENIKGKLEGQEVNSDKQWLIDKIGELSKR